MHWKYMRNQLFYLRRLTNYHHHPKDAFQVLMPLTHQDYAFPDKIGTCLDR